MLLLGSKTIVVDGITIFADHADPNQFWYLPGPVKLSRREPNNQADLVFIKYKPAVVEAGVKGGGFLMLSVNLQLDPALEQKILSKLSATAPGRPKLAAVPFDEGTVQCLALNLQGSGGTTAPTAPPGTFNAIEKILGATVPSLDARNSASFGLTLSQEGAIILEKAFEQGTTPIGVLYDLKYTAMRPALDVKITADFKRIYTHFSASLEGQYYFFRVGIEAAFEKLVQEGAIKIEVLNFTGAADQAEKEKQAIEFFRDHLLRQWFEPTLAPGQPLGGTPTPTTPTPTTPTPSTPTPSTPTPSTPTPSTPTPSTPTPSTPTPSTPTPSTPTPDNPSGGAGSSGGGSSTPNAVLLSRHAPSTRTAAANRPAAQLEILSSEPSPLPDGYRLQHTPAASGLTETLTVQGGTNPVVRVNGAVRSLDANRQFTLDVAEASSADIVVEYPRTLRDETFHLFFEFEKPQEAGWSTTSPVYRSYLNNAPSPVDSEFSSTTSRSGITDVAGTHRSGDGNQLRTWIRTQLADPKDVTIEGYASFENETPPGSKQSYNQRLSQRRRQIAVGIAAPLVNSISGTAPGNGYIRARTAARVSDWRDRVAEVTGKVTDNPPATLRARLSRGASTPSPTDPTEPTNPTNPPNPNPPNPTNPNPEPTQPGNNRPPTQEGSPVLALKLKFIRQEEQKTLTFHYHRSEAVQRTYAPQGLIGLLLADLQDKRKHFVEVDLDDPFFRVFSVSVDAPIDFQRIGLLSAQVAIDYGDPTDPTTHKHTDFVFEPGAQTKRKFEVFLNRRFDTAYAYSVQYHFDPGSDWDGHAFTYEVPAKRTEDRTLQIQPFADLGFLDLRVFANRIDWGVIDSVDVQLSYASPAGWTREKGMTFTIDSPPQFWKLRLDRPDARTYSYRCVYHLRDGSKQEAPSVTSTASAIPINDLFEGALDLEFIPLFSAEQVRMVFIDVKYDDPTNRYHREERLELPGTATAPVPLRIALKDRTQRTFQYRLTFVESDNRLHRGPFVTTQETLIEVLKVV